MYGLKMCLGSDHYKPALLAPVGQLGQLAVVHLVQRTQ